MISDKNIPFQTIDWELIPKTEHKGGKRNCILADDSIAWIKD